MRSLWGGAARRPESALAGWLIVATLAAAGSALSAFAVAAGAPPWIRGASLAVGAAGIAGYAAVFRRQRGLERQPAGGAGLPDPLRLAAAFGRLGAGDLVGARQGAQALPARLAAGLTAAGDALAAIAEQIQDGSIEVAAAADDVNRVATELASGSSQQSASVVEITAAMEELARTAGQIAASAAHQAELARRAEAHGDEGAAAVAAAVAGVEDVRGSIAGVAARADDLGSRTKEIYRVLELIAEIADETHVLSLNAAIEGAAAGAGGRRFAVVAEEVRRLAHRSRESVESVRALLDEFASSTRATIVATEEGAKEASRVSERSRSAAAAIVTLRRAAGDTARVAGEISLATRQQNGASDEVVMTLREVSQVVQRMSGGLAELSGTAGRLTRLGLALQLLAQSFHLDSPRSLKHRVEEWSAELERCADAGELDRALGERVRATPFLEMGYLVDLRGYTVSLHQNGAAGPGARGAEWAREIDMTRRPWFRAVVRERRTSLTPTYVSLSSGEPCFTVACPVRGGDGELAGVLGVDVNVTGWTRI